MLRAPWRSRLLMGYWSIRLGEQTKPVRLILGCARWFWPSPHPRLPWASGTSPFARPARLISRHWVITDADGKVQEVRGKGVVGEQPQLQPGAAFRYSSGAVLETALGSMQGSYQMEADDGTKFDAPIAPFRLAIPGVLH